MRLLLAAIAGASAALAAGAAAFAQPSIPATFFGSVTVDGRPAESGVEVRGLIGGVDCTQAPVGTRPVIRDGETSAYVLHVMHESQRPGCAREGATVTFTIAGVGAVQQAPWKPGPNRLDLSTGAASPIPLPSATGTVAAAITAAVSGTQEPGASSTAIPRPSGVPPTDDVDIPGLTSSRTAVPQVPGTGDDDDGGGSALVWLLLVLGVLARGAGGVGVYLSRRRKVGS